MLLHRERVIRAALHRGVVAHDHALDAAHPADAGDDAGAGGLVVVHVHGRQRRQLEERRARIKQRADALLRQQLAAPDMALAGFLAAAQPDFLDAPAQVVDQRAHGVGVLLEGVGAGVDLGGKNGHARTKLPGPADQGKRDIARQLKPCAMKAFWLAQAAANSGSWLARSFNTIAVLARKASSSTGGHCLMTTPAAFSFSSAWTCGARLKARGVTPTM